MLANREGRFHAYPVEIGLAESRRNKLLQVNILYRLFQELSGGQWVDCSGENLEITGYHTIEKQDHSLNENTIESLKAALGWDGRDPFWLQDNAGTLAQQPVQVKLAMEEFDGKYNLKVAFLNPYGSQRGGVPKADDEARRAIANRLGGKFRALAGGTPANPPKPKGKPTTGGAPSPAKPAAAPKQASASAQPPTLAAPTATMNDAWAEFTRHCPSPKWDQEAVEKEWFRILADLFPGRQSDQLTGAEWAVMLAEGPSHIIPF